MADSTLPRVSRGGTYYRVCKPDWADCADTSFSKQFGGCWNVPNEFGALYLNKTVRLAAAQARHQHAGRAITLFDLQPHRLPVLATFDVPTIDVVDASSAEGLAALELQADYPVGVGWKTCQLIARRAYRESFAGVAARSAAEARVADVVGEELARFDSQPPLEPLELRPFENWYPDPYPSA